MSEQTRNFIRLQQMYFPLIFMRFSSFLIEQFLGPALLLLLAFFISNAFFDPASVRSLTFPWIQC